LSYIKLFVMVMLHIKQVRSCDKSIHCPVCVCVSLSQHL